MIEFNYLTDLSWLSLLLLVGVLTSILASKIKLPDVLLLLIFGVIVGQFKLVVFGQSFLTSLGIFALIMVVFASTSRFKPKEVNLISPYALKLSIIFLFSSIVFLTIFVFLLFNLNFSLDALLLSLIFSSIMSGTSPEAILSLLNTTKAKIFELIEFESIINTPFTIIFPLLFLTFYLGNVPSAKIVLTSFMQEIVTGVGTGIVLGLITFKLMKKSYIQTLSPIALIAVALVTYTLSDFLGGNGVLAVTTLGLLFGMMEIREKSQLNNFIAIFTNFLKIVMFVLLGLLINLSFSYIFIIKSIILFVLYLGVRYFAVHITFMGYNMSFKEKLFMSLNIAKGVPVAVVAFILASLLNAELAYIIDLTFLFIFYSIIVNSIAVSFFRYFITVDRLPKKSRKVKVS